MHSDGWSNTFHNGREREDKIVGREPLLDGNVDYYFTFLRRIALDDEPCIMITLHDCCIFSLGRLSTCW
jgi:hypothetical protein